jgi:hypothetical protein
MDVKPDFERIMARWDTILKYSAYPSDSNPLGGIQK